MSVGLKVDGLMIVIVAGIVVGSVIYIKRKSLIESVNPLSEKNIAYSGVSSAVNNLSNGKYKDLGDYTYQTRATNPLAWLFEGIGRLNGDLP